VTVRVREALTALVDALKAALLNHRESAARALLGWLEEEADGAVARKLGGALGHERRCADKRRHVTVVTAQAATAMRTARRTTW
jgi:hypothetical protein